MDSISLKLSDASKASRVSSLLEGFALSADSVKRIRSVFEAELELGMQHGLERSCLQMENTYVPEMTDGSEEGDYLALDLGGTNFRVMLLQIKEGKIQKEEVSYYHVEESLRLGPGFKLFDFLATCILDFVTKQGLSDRRLPLGFTFSFPMTQTALDSGVLVNWTKSFNCPGVIGTDAVQQLRDAIQRVGSLKVDVVAILNDTTGTLVRGAFDDPRTCIGLILGTGCNGAYIERADRVLRWGGHRYDAKHVIVDPEFGAFGDNGCVDFVKTEFDRAIDKDSLLPGSFTYEKYFAGKYIGELARRVFVKLHSEGLMFEGGVITADAPLNQTDAFSTADLSEVETDTVEGSSGRTEAIATRLTNGLKTSTDDVALMQYLCALLSHRCAMLVGIALAVLLCRMDDRDEGVVAVTGSLYKCHPRLKDLLEKYTTQLSGKRCVTFLSDDGSGKGAGLIAAIAHRMATKGSKN